MARFPRNVVLLGMRGAGKTTVARLLGTRLGRHVIDTDAMVADWEGLGVAEVFAAYGEAHFRDVEADVVAEVTRRGGKVIATGGGVVLRPANVDRLRGSGLTLWLRASPGTLRERLARDPAGLAERPGLTGADPLAELDALAAARTATYAAAADHVVDTDGCDAAAVAEACARWLAAPGCPTDYDPDRPCPASQDGGA
jgi:shikimate kinase